MAKGYKCPTCKSQTGEYSRGAYHCGNPHCETVTWGPFDKPSAGEPRKGYACWNCEGQTLHPIAKVAEAEVYRCSVCGTTHVERARV
jgi:hypothetical protein